MRRDGDEFLAVALLDPRRHRLDRMSQRVGADRLEPRRAERAARGCAASGRSAALRRAARVRGRPPRVSHCGAGAFALDDARLPFAGRAARDEEHGVEAAHRVEFRAPSARTASARRRRAAARLRASSVGEGLIGDQRRLELERASPRRGGAQARPEPRSPRSSRGSPRPRAASTPSSSASARSAASIRPPGKTSAPAANAMPSARSTISSSGGPLGGSRTTIRVAAGIASSASHLGRAGQRKSRPEGSGGSFRSARARLHAADVLLLASLGLVVSSAAAFSSLSCCCWLPSASASAFDRGLVGEVVELSAPAGSAPHC